MMFSWLHKCTWVHLGIVNCWQHGYKYIYKIYIAHLDTIKAWRYCKKIHKMQATRVGGEVIHATGFDYLMSAFQMSWTLGLVYTLHICIMPACSCYNLFFKVFFISSPPNEEVPKCDRKRRWAKRRELAVESFLLRPHMGTPSRELTTAHISLSIDVRHIVHRTKKKPLFSYVELISVFNRRGLTRPWRSLNAYFSIVLQDTNLKLSHNTKIYFKTMVSNLDIQNNPRIIAFFIKAVFHHFFKYFLI